MAKNTSVLGIYQDRQTVCDATGALVKAGYRAADIAVLSSDEHGSKDFAHRKRNKAFQMAAMGTAIAAAIGAIVAVLVSMQAVTLTGIGQPFLGAGPVLAGLAGAGAGGALGWIVGLLAGLRGTEYVAVRYAGRIRSGGLLLSVHCDSPEWCARARKILKDTGARDISTETEAAADYGTTDRPSIRPSVTPPEVLVARSDALEPQPLEYAVVQPLNAHDDDKATLKVGDRL